MTGSKSVDLCGFVVLSDCCVRDYVLGWQWCDTEKKAAWAALLATST